MSREWRTSSQATGILACDFFTVETYNFERPHRGYRTKGRRPAEIFYADRPDLLQMKGWDADEFTPQSVRF